MINDDWYRYYAPRRLATLTAEQQATDHAAAQHDIEAVLARTGLRPTDRILEVGCGWGRHSLALARRAYGAVVSIDIAPEPLALAEQLARDAGLLCDLRQRSFCDVDEGGFQAILSLYDRSVCGFPTEAEDQCSLHRLAGLLAPGGWLVFGINDWPFYLPQASQRWHETHDGLELLEVQPDRVAMTCTDRVTLVRPDGRRETYALTRRHYYLPELCRLLAGAGFELVAALHRLVEQRPYGDGGDGLFIYARRM
jgi:SAM-dependent methyltransferase